MRRMQVCSRPLNCACFRSGWILEPSITTTRSSRLRKISLGLSLVFACTLSANALAKETEAEKAAKEAAAQEKLLQVFISEPYLELSTGPGRGYPVFHVVERDASVDVLFRRTDWFKVRDEQGVEGWARANDLRRAKLDRKSTRLNSSHSQISYAVFCLKKKKTNTYTH